MNWMTDLTHVSYVNLIVIIILMLIWIQMQIKIL